MTVLRILLVLLAACASSTPSQPSTDAPNIPDASAQVPPDAPNPELWVLSGDGIANWLYQVDPVTFAITRSVDVARTGDLWELAGTSGAFAYAIDRDADVLVALELGTGAVVSAVKLDGDMQKNGRGFGTSSSGALLGVFAGTLQTIDASTGALSQSVTLVNGIRAESIESCNGQLYMASRETGSPRGEKLYRVERASGSAVLVGTIGPTPIDIDMLACFAGKLYGVDADPTLGRTVFEIDPATADVIGTHELPVAGTIGGLHATDPATGPLS